MKNNSKKVYVGLSGGVDSSVSAYLLKKEGYEVTGVFIKVWQPDFVSCTWQEDRLFAMRAASHLQIPFVTLDLEKEYKKEVIDYMLSEYGVSRTPNPDVMCNKEVKFGAFLSWALSQGADYIATGHYARNTFNEKTGLHQLLRGKDNSKDQSYFLWALKQNVLEKVLFPIGHLKKTEVRKIAKEIKLPNAEKKDSQGLCFISNVDMKIFLSNFFEKKSGDVLNESGEIVGHHQGAIFFTIGERRGFTITSKKSNDKPYYVIGKDLAKNTITVSNKEAKNKVGGNKILLENVNFISGEPNFGKKYDVEFRYHGEKTGGFIEKDQKGIHFVSESPVLVSPGQSVVIYDGEVSIGGGIIV